MNKSWLLVAVFVAVAGCSERSAPPVVLDGWWNTDYAKEACHTLAPAMGGEACLGDLRRFERELQAQVAADPTCHTVQLFAYEGPATSKPAVEAAAGPHWNLSLNYVPGAMKQRWAMLGPSKSGAVLEGEGSAPEIAKAVCGIVKHRGGSIGG
jgi:hypothetical protein